MTRPELTNPHSHPCRPGLGASIAIMALLGVLEGCAGAGGVPPPTREVTSARSPALGPYAPAVVAGDFVFVSGQLPYVAESKQMLQGGIEIQARQALANADALLRAAGTSRDRVVKVTVYLADGSDFAGMNEAFSEFFAGHRPARTTVPGVNLPPGVGVEIDMIALR